MIQQYRTTLDRIIAEGPKTRSQKPRREEDENLPFGMRRCLVATHQGERILSLPKFPNNPTAFKGKGYKCRECYNRMRRMKRAKQSEKRPRLGAVREGIKVGYFRIVQDPHGLFRLGLFRKFDFAISFHGKDPVWAEGTIIEDETGQRFVVQYEPHKGLLRDDGVLFSLDNRHWSFLEVDDESK